MGRIYPKPQNPKTPKPHDCEVFVKRFLQFIAAGSDEAILRCICLCANLLLRVPNLPEMLQLLHALGLFDLARF